MVLENSINRILIVMICILPFLVTPGFFDVYYFIKAAGVIILTLLILMKWILYEREKRSQFKHMALISKTSIVLLGLLVISMFFTENLLNSVIGHENRWDGLILQTCYILLLIFSSYYFILSDKNMHYILISGCVMSFVGLLQFLGIIKSSYRHFPFNETFSRAFGTLGNVNFMGHYLVIILSISVYYYFREQKGRYLISSSFIYAIFLTTNTRGAWLGGIVALSVLVVYTVFKERKYKRVIMLLITFTIVTISLDLLLNGVLVLRFLSVIFEFGDLIAPGPPDPSGGSYRIALWLDGLNSIPQKPFFGVGISNYYLILDRTAVFGENVRSNAHNDYLNYAVTTGIPSALVYTSIIVIGIYKSFVNLKRNKFSVLLLAIIAAFAVQSVVTMTIASYSFIMWILLGAVARLNRGDKNHVNLRSIKTS